MDRALNFMEKIVENGRTKKTIPKFSMVKHSTMEKRMEDNIFSFFPFKLNLFYLLTICMA